MHPEWNQLDTGWNLQRHLLDMESRIRSDIQSVGRVAAQAQADADENKFDLGQLAVRTTTIESNLKWMYSGIFAGVIALVGFAWKMISGGK